MPERVLIANPSDHPTELMTLRGARFALIEETPEARHLSVKRLKDTVGTPTMTARLIGKNNVTWEATHSLFLTTNYTPRVDETDHGTRAMNHEQRLEQPPVHRALLDLQEHAGEAAVLGRGGEARQHAAGQPLSAVRGGGAHAVDAGPAVAE